MFFTEARRWSWFVVTVGFDSDVEAKVVQDRFNRTGFFDDSARCNLTYMVAGPRSQFSLNVVQQPIHLCDMVSDRIAVTLMLFGMHVFCRFEQRIGFFVSLLETWVVLVVVEHIQAQSIGFSFQPASQIFTTSKTAKLKLNRLGDLHWMQLCRLKRRRIHSNNRRWRVVMRIPLNVERSGVLMHALMRWNYVVPVAVAKVAAVMMNDIQMVSVLNNIVVAVTMDLGICGRGKECRTTACESAKNLKS